MTDTGDLGILLETLCPMFVLVDTDGRIARAGPTLQKLRPDQTMSGKRFLDVFELVRPRDVTTLSALFSSAGAKLHLKLQNSPRTALKGLVAPTANPQKQSGLGSGDIVRGLGVGPRPKDAIAGDPKPDIRWFSRQHTPN